MLHSLELHNSPSSAQCDAHALSSDCKQDFMLLPGQYSKHGQVQTTLAAAQHIMLVTLKLTGM